MTNNEKNTVDTAATEQTGSPEGSSAATGGYAAPVDGLYVEGTTRRVEITIDTPRQGEGKTRMAFLLAHLLRERGHEVVIDEEEYPLGMPGVLSRGYEENALCAEEPTAVTIRVPQHDRTRRLTPQAPHQ